MKLSLILPLFLLGASFSSAADATNTLPKYSAETYKIGVPITIRGFQGPKPDSGDLAFDECIYQDLLRTKVSIPKELPTPNEVSSFIENPYLTTVFSIYADKIASNSDRFLLSTPECIPTLTEYCDFAFNEATKRIFENVDEVLLLHSITKGNKVYVFYLLNKDKPKARDYLVKVLVKRGPVYLLDCSNIEDPLIVNFFNALPSGELSKFIFQKI
ncbi:MAG: hypothetical protein H2172_18470 [Opitutus sp.]|jgi:hypothetical protein|nr:hypothetical protein [Opitutus sp.]MCS6274847.1 hypothetical protein [Opitutus sp.]MCS6278396.1 hypothetical protein [Opitutus sp.]MCS6299506.1 hypothetical protein [Opitutus sp.]